VLKRQVEDLTRLVERAEKGTLMPKDKLVVGVSEQMVEKVMRLALPREQVVLRDYRVRLERADVSFLDGHGALRFDGRVTPAAGAASEDLAEMALFGRVDTVELDPSTGTLRGQIVLTGFELKRLGGRGEGEAGRQLIQELARQGVDVLEPLAFPLTIPVKLEQEVALKGSPAEGPVRLQAARFPLTVTVAEVTAHSHRLWVALDVTLGAFTKVSAAPTLTPPSGAPGEAP
jgi:hypothetical protein